MKKILIGIIVVAVLGFSVYYAASGLVKLSYDSESVVFEDKTVDPSVLEQVGSSIESEESEEPIEDGVPEVIEESNYRGYMQFDETKYDMGSEYSIGIPNSVYNTKNLEDRAAVYLGENYDTYTSYIQHIKEVGAVNISSLNYEYTSEEILPEEKISVEDLGTITWEDMQAVKSLSFKSISQSDNDSGLDAIAFFDNYYVVYRTYINNGLEEVFIVVDYSKTGFDKLSTLIPYGGISGQVIVYKDNAVYEDYMGKHIIYAPMWDVAYYDRNGKEYHGQDIIDNAGKTIDW